MRKTFVLIISAFALFLSVSCTRRNSGEKAVLRVIENQVGTIKGIQVKLSGSAEDGLDSYKLTASEGKVLIEATTPTAACYGFNEYLQAACGGMISWSGKHLPLGESWPDWSAEGKTPYEHRNFLNVCTFGYTAPYCSNFRLFL